MYFVHSNFLSYFVDILDLELESRWKVLLERLNKQFEADLDIDGVIFLIGIQELGKGKVELGKDQKLDVMHIATCKLLVPYGYYEYEGMDAEGWPHYTPKMQVPRLSPGQQKHFMKQAILEYFELTENID